MVVLNFSGASIVSEYLYVQIMIQNITIRVSDVILKPSPLESHHFTDQLAIRTAEPDILEVSHFVYFVYFWVWMILN